MEVLRFRDLRADEIEVRIASCDNYRDSTRGWVQLLLYKDARCDMKILDETVGINKWQRKHYKVKDSMFCSVGVKFDDEWVWKDDAGDESYTEKVKGESSDSFKRACVNWGIGRELYTSPPIFMDAEVESKNKLKDSKKIVFKVEEIEIQDKKITGLKISMEHTKDKLKSYFIWGALEVPKEAKETKPNLEKPPEIDVPQIEPIIKTAKQTLIDVAKTSQTDCDMIKEILENEYKVKKINELTESEAAAVLKRLQ